MIGQSGCIPARTYSGSARGSVDAKVVRTRRSFEDRREQRSADPLAQQVRPDEQVGEVDRAAGVDRRAEPDDLLIDERHAVRRPRRMRWAT